MLEDFASGHTRPVAAKHYADIGAHEETHDQAVEAGLAQALGVALAPPVVLSDDGDRLDDSQAALTAREIESALTGEQDVWLASCRDFFASPFARKPGAACPVPAWGCLECPNAVFTSPTPAEPAVLPGLSGATARGIPRRRVDRAVRSRVGSHRPRCPRALQHAPDRHGAGHR